MRMSDWSSDVCSSDLGGTAQFVATDVSQEEDVKALVAAAVRTYGKLDGACNAAGVSQRGKIMHEVTAEEWDRCHGINLRGMFLCNKYEVLSMIETGGGAIVNIASTVSMVAVQNGAEYCASKAGVMGLVRGGDRKSTRLHSSHSCAPRMPSFACKN